MGLKKLIEGMGENDYMLDHDLNLTVLSPNLRASLKIKLNVSKRLDVSRFLTMVICFTENGEINDEILIWDEDEYRAYLASGEITEDQDNEYVEEFLKNF